jgi:hypothetical protein
MSKPHLQRLQEALGRKGWRIVAVHPGDGYRISATWEVQRNSRQPSAFIDFEEKLSPSISEGSTEADKSGSRNWH